MKPLRFQDWDHSVFRERAKHSKYYELDERRIFFLLNMIFTPAYEVWSNAGVFDQPPCAEYRRLFHQWLDDGNPLDVHDWLEDRANEMHLAAVVYPTSEQDL